MSARLVKDINRTGSSSPNDLISIGGILYFAADSQGSGVDNNTNNGTNDNDNSEDGENTSNNQSNPNTTSNGAGLWKSDGSEGGSVLLKSFDSVNNLVAANGMLYFIAETEGNFEIWSSDGTSGGTKRVDALYPGGDTFAAYNLFSVEDALFFSASGPENNPSGYELWRWQGDDVGTKLFSNLFPDRYIKTQTIDVDEETGERTLTVETEEFNSSTPAYSPDSFPGNFTRAGGGNFFFTAYTSIEYPSNVVDFPDQARIGGIELWFSDGTENGTYSIPINNQTYEIYNPVSGSSSPPSLYDEYYIASGSSFPKELTPFQNKLYFTANDGLNGFELFSISNEGTGENLVKNIHPTSSSTPKELTVVGKNLYFTADPGSGRKLYILEGNSNKPVVVANSGKKPRDLTEINGSLYYSADSGNGREPWIARGINANELQNINPGIASSNPSNFKQIRQKDGKKNQNLLFFTSNNGSNGFELWAKDLDDENTKARLAADIYTGIPSSYPENLINSNQALFFTADNGKSGRELWTFDVTADQDKDDGGNNNEGGADDSKADSSLVSNIRPGRKSSNPAYLNHYKGQFYFSANDGKQGDEMWTSQGSKGSTKIFKNINPGKSSSSPSDFTNYKSLMYFSSNNGVNGQELWSSDGKAKSTKLLSDINPGPGSSSPSDLLGLNNRLYFAANDGQTGRELWSHSLRTGVSSIVRDIRKGSGIGSNPSNLVALNEQLFFAAEGDTYGRELWVSDGNLNGTQMLKDINPGGLDSNPDDLSVMNNNIYFTATTYFNGRQILKLDGESMMISGVTDSIEDNISSDPDDLHATDVQLFYSAETKEPAAQGGGTDEGTDADAQSSRASEPSTRSSNVENINNYNQNMDDYKNEGDCFNLEIARSWALFQLEDEGDSSLAQDWNTYASECNLTAIAIPSGSNINNSGTSNSQLDDRQSLGRELWTSDGKAEGNRLLKDINPGKASSNPTAFTTVGTMTYFSAEDGEYGEELWVTDGTADGTYRLTDINEGSKDSSPRSITESNGRIYFSAKTDKLGRELWRLGTADSGTKSSGPSKQTNLNLTRIGYSKKGKARLTGKNKTMDEFIFATKNQFGNNKADRITGFSSKDGDTLQLDHISFPGLKKIRFRSTTSIAQFNKEMGRKSSIIYFQPSGELYFDANGKQPGLGDDRQSGLFAILKDGPVLSGSDIAMI